MNKLIIRFYVFSTAAIYLFLSNLIGLSPILQIIGTFTIFAIFFGLWSYIDSKKYDGQIIIKTSESGNTLFSLELEGDPADLRKKQVVSFKIVSTLE